MKYADIKYFDVINGEGVRVSIFVSGCSHHCEHCFNPKTWNPNYGSEFDETVKQNIFDYIKKLNSTIKGISFLGGDPTYKDNIQPTIDFINEFKEKFPNKDIWIWSGYTFEQILEREDLLSLISLCDVLVEGKFENEKKDLKLKFRGSSNQRVINVKKSIEFNKVILHCE